MNSVDSTMATHNQLTAAQVRALAHVAEMSAHVEGHNARWPLDKQTVGAHGGTRWLPAKTVERLIALGLLVEVESWPAYRCKGVYALTDVGREVLRSAQAKDPKS